MAYADAETQKQYAQRHYQDNKALYKSRAMESKTRVRNANRLKIVAYLLEHPCTDCGEPDPVVLQFDHIGADKIADVCRMVSHSCSWKKISPLS